ncbi:uncharacterized protein LOC109838060 isoform X2 [Asparagus officinalis]|nr:uncharacterized protein LOC109838060 isoform X2 [Asparagus officinalis]XP_020262104.1 uncharacterized protein LOC109838060 isoform X2 [Asparagus officinalis]
MPSKVANLIKKKSTDILGKKRLYDEPSTEPYTEKFMDTYKKKQPNDCHKSSTTDFFSFDRSHIVNQVGNTTAKSMTVSQVSRPKRNAPSVYCGNISPQAHVVHDHVPTVDDATPIIDGNDGETCFIDNAANLLLSAVSHDNNKKGNRKPTKLETFRTPPGQKHMVTWRDGQPISRTAFQFSQELGYYARIDCYLFKDYFIWESEDEDPKNPGIKLSVNMFIVVRWYTLTVQAALRSWKTTLKKKYYDQWKNASPQQRYLIVFDRITRNVWEDFVKYIDNLDKKKETSTNMINVGKKTSALFGIKIYGSN